MIKLNFAHLCSSAYILDNGTPAIIGIFSRIEAHGPVMQDKVTVVLDFSPNDTEAHKVDFILKSPSEKIISKSESNTVGPASQKDRNLGLIANIKDIKLEEQGNYKLEIRIDGSLIEDLLFNFSISAK